MEGLRTKVPCAGPSCFSVLSGKRLHDIHSDSGFAGEEAPAPEGEDVERNL